jgi:hypothetical protein
MTNNRRKLVRKPGGTGVIKSGGRDDFHVLPRRPILRTEFNWDDVEVVPTGDGPADLLPDHHPHLITRRRHTGRKFLLAM